MPTSLPPDPVQMEQVIRKSLRDLIAAVPGVGQVHMRERFPSSDEQDLELSTIPDPVSNNLARTNIIQIGIPTVDELEYTGDQCTQLNLSYPITFDLEVVDEWDNSDETLEFGNSSDLFLAIYLRARLLLKRNRDLGFNNCVHDYLQQISAGTVRDEETGGRWHSADWAITVKITSVLS